MFPNLGTVRFFSCGVKKNVSVHTIRRTPPPGRTWADFFHVKLSEKAGMAAAYDLLVRLLVECEGDVVPSKEVWKVPLPRYKSACAS